MAAAGLGELLPARVSSSSLTVNVAFPAPAVQSEIDELKAEIRKQKAKLDTLEEELEDETRQLKQAAMANDEKKATTLQGFVEETKGRLSACRDRLSSAKSDLKQLTEGAHVRIERFRSAHCHSCAWSSWRLCWLSTASFCSLVDIRASSLSDVLPLVHSFCRAHV